MAGEKKDSDSQAHLFSLDDIRNKEELTGEDVGRASLYNMAARYKNLLERGKAHAVPAETIGSEELGELVDSLDTREDVEAYSKYIGIQNYIAKEQGFSNAFIQRAQFAHRQLKDICINALAYEETLSEVSRLPLIMTEKQYQDEVSATIEINRSKGASYGELWCELWKYKDIPAELLSAINKTDPLPLDNERVIKKYCRANKLDIAGRGSGRIKAAAITQELDVYYPYVFWLLGNEQDVSNQVEEFYRDFPLLAKALEKCTRRLLPSVSIPPKEKWQDPIITYGELSDKGILNYRKKLFAVSDDDMRFCTSESDLISKHRAMFGGLAVLKWKDVDSSMLDINGHYIQRGVPASVAENIISQAPDTEDTREIELEDSMAEVYAYEAILDIITEHTGVDVSIFSQAPNIKIIEAHIGDLNKYAEDLKKRIEENSYLFTDEEQEERIQKVGELLPIITLSKSKPTKSAINKVYEYTTDLDAFRRDTPLIVEMMKKRKGGD